MSYYDVDRSEEALQEDEELIEAVEKMVTKGAEAIIDDVAEIVHHLAVHLFEQGWLSPKRTLTVPSVAARVPLVSRCRDFDSVADSDCSLQIRN